MASTDTTTRVAAAAASANGAGAEQFDVKNPATGETIASLPIHTADHVRLEALARSQYEPLANATQKIIREEKYHLMHGDMWLNRLATLSPVSREHLEVALREVGDEDLREHWA